MSVLISNSSPSPWLLVLYRTLLHNHLTSAFVCHEVPRPSVKHLSLKVCDLQLPRLPSPPLPSLCRCTCIGRDVQGEWHKYLGERHFKALLLNRKAQPALHNARGQFWSEESRKWMALLMGWAGRRMVSWIVHHFQPILWMCHLYLVTAGENFIFLINSLICMIRKAISLMDRLMPWQIET